MPFTVRGTCQVEWTPAYTLTLVSTDGTTLNGDGLTHPLAATLTHTAGGSPVPNKQLLLNTSPAGKVGDGLVRVTGTDGKATFSVSDTSNETVDYTAAMLPRRAITGKESVDWFVPSPPAPPVPPGTPMTLGPPTGYDSIDFPGGSTILYIYTVGNKASIPVSLGIAGVEIALTGNSDLGVTIAPNVTTNGSGNATFTVTEPTPSGTVNATIVAYVVSNPSVAVALSNTPFTGKGNLLWH